jgi:hypothetical protein
VIGDNEQTLIGKIGVMEMHIDAEEETRQKAQQGT